MSIKTISDLEQASEEEVNQVLSDLSIVQDILEYKHWLEMNPQELDIRWTIKTGRSLGVHPSTICKPRVCPLRVYYECTGDVERDREYSLDRHNTFDIGHAIHAKLQAYARQIYNTEEVHQFDDEVRLKDKNLHITSRADGIFNFSKYRFVWEIKSIKEGSSQYGFEKVQVKPLIDNVRQLQIYMRLADVPFGLLYYECKNNGMVKEHPLVYDGGKVWKEITTMLEPVVVAAYEGGPPVEGTPGASCRFCDYSYGCPAIRKHNERKRKGSRHSGRPPVRGGHRRG